jgi:tetratricopeptide (TPR) repeat protein
LKTNIIKYILVCGFLVFLIACSTKKNSFVSRNSHALSTKYNILYNGGIALDKGVEDLKLQYNDNFWERLPVERMQVSEEKLLPGENKNANFDRAETKAIKAIQKHSMNIQGSEKNPQMDEAHLMLGKSRYYDQRFVPALEAFNYVLYKYPKSDKIYEVKIWREKTNMRLENDALAVNNLRKLLREIKFRDQIFADANATLAQAFLNLEEKDSAVAKLKIATEYTKSNEEKSRYRFILGQLYDELKYKDSAFVSYQSVIDMNRKAGRHYVIQSHIKQAAYFDYEKGDTIAFLKKYDELLEDRENRPYLDVLNHQLGLFYDKKNSISKAKKYYNASLKKRSADIYLTASNYRNLANIYFNSAKYVTAGKYFDSTLVQLQPRTREYNLIKKKRENLDDVIKYEGIAQRNDSIISVFNMSSSERVKYYEEYIVGLKKEDEKLKLLAEKQARIAANSGGNVSQDGQKDIQNTDNIPGKKNISAPSVSNPSASGKPGDFYFYNPATVAFGKNEFKKIWGDRTLQDNWRVASLTTKKDSKDSNDEDDESVIEEEKKEKDKALLDERYSADFYINQLPQSQTVIDSLSKERNFAYYQLGTIYKEKFKEYQLAVNKLEQLLKNNPEERLVLPSMYNLFKLYEILDKDKAEAMKARIISQYPDSRYAQILSNATSPINSSESPSETYDNLFTQYKNGEYKTVYANVELAIDKFTGEELVPKFELLKAYVIAKLKGLDEYKKALNFVALNYPNSEEGKESEKLLGVNIPKLEALQLTQEESKNWKILYKSVSPDDKNSKILHDKIKKFIADRSLDKLTTSYDIYTMTDNFIVIHNMKSEDLAKGIVSILKEFKEYKIQETPIIISSENYAVVQIKKNSEDYLAGKFVANAPKPNWDGTVEKTDQPKPVPVNASSNENKIPEETKKQIDTKKGIQEDDEKNSGLPPSPQTQQTQQPPIKKRE